MDIIETNLNFYSLNYGNVPNKIILHHAEWPEASVEDIHICHKTEKGFSGIGYHYYVRKDGKIYKGRPDNCIGAHCIGQNWGSIGICAEGAYDVEHMPEVQKQAVIQLCKYLCELYGIDKSQIYGHCEIGKGDGASSCPGDNYPLQEIKNLIIDHEESVDMEKVVLYYGDADVFSAIIVSQRYNCPLMKLEDYKAKGLNAQEVIQIGGLGATVSGEDRYETFKNAGSLV